MAHQVTWLRAALDDIDSIAEYIAADSPAYASVVAARLINESRLIGERPFAGRVVPEISEESIRERFVYNYRLIYEVGTASVTMLTVLHGARRFPEWLAERRP